MSSFEYQLPILVKTQIKFINLGALAGMSEERSREEIITDWVVEYNNDLYRYALRKMPDEKSAEDMVQNTFLAGFTSYDKFKGESSPKTWLMAILKNKIMDHYRSVYRKNEVSLNTDHSQFDEDGNWLKNEIPAEWDDKHVLDDPEFRLVFDRCISDLPDQWNTAIRMKYLNSELTPEIVGITRANYWKMLERARRQLRTCLENNWFASEK
jgi:RNA polymerase sigma-70 factor (TIGR02943 family)